MSDVVKLVSGSDLHEAALLESSVFKDSHGMTTDIDDVKRDQSTMDNYGVFRDGKLVGYTRVNPNPSGGALLGKIKEYHPDVGYIVSTSVSPDHRNTGVAKSIRARVQKDYDSLLTRSTRGYSDIHIDKLNVSTGFSVAHKNPDTNSTLYFWSK